MLALTIDPKVVKDLLASNANVQLLYLRASGLLAELGQLPQAVRRDDRWLAVEGDAYLALDQPKQALERYESAHRQRPDAWAYALREARAQFEREFIASTLESVLQQTYRHLEIVITDNDSTDGTVAQIRKFTDPRIRLIQNEANLGLGANWNKALSCATGTYVKLLCADDLIYPDCLQRQVEALETERQAGRAAIAVLPVHYPKELLTALDILAVELWGPPGPPRSEAAGRIQTYVCPIGRNALAFLASGGADAVDAVLFPHTCDTVQGLATLLPDFGGWSKKTFTFQHPKGPPRPTRTWRRSSRGIPSRAAAAPGIAP